MTTDLPIEAVRAKVIEAWRKGGCIVSAPPGSGKTTRLPLWIAEQSTDFVYLLIPKRLPVVMAAKRLAKQRQEPVGQTVGYQLRGEKSRSDRTQLLVTTYGSFLQLLLNDPDALSGSTIILDEFHERSVDQDTTYALLHHLISQLDDSIKRIVMSATLNVEQIQKQLNLPLIESDGRSFPINVEYKKTDVKSARAIASIIETEVSSSNDHTLVFFPGLAEIRQVERALSGRHPVIVLHSQLDNSPDLQALDTAEPTIILATNIAESSITLARVHLVIDTGIERYAKEHPVTGLTELKTRRISKASAQQRAGRAGRLGPGRCIRLWSKDDHASLVNHQPPEIAQANLTLTRLQSAAWGADKDELVWLDTPNVGRWQSASEQLMLWAAIDHNQQLTQHGKKMLHLGLEPWLSHLLALPDKLDQQISLIYLSAHLMTDTPFSYDPFKGSTTAKLETVVLKEANRLASRMSIELTKALPALQQMLFVRALADRLILWTSHTAGQLVTGSQVTTRMPAESGQWAILLNAIQKDNRFYCDRWIAVQAEVVFKASPPKECVLFQPNHASKPFIKHSKIGKILLNAQPTQPTQQEKISAWTAHIKKEGEAAFNWDSANLQLKQRWQLLAKLRSDWPEWPESRHWADLTAPFLPLCARLSDAPLNDILLAGLGFPFNTQIDTLAPTHWHAPSGRSVSIEYDSNNLKAGATIKMQEAFGLTTQPLIFQTLPLTLVLTAPNGRPIANVTDVSYFWDNVYPDVRKELRGRYNKHPWPENPTTALPTHKTNRQLRADSNP